MFNVFLYTYELPLVDISRHRKYPPMLSMLNPQITKRISEPTSTSSVMSTSFALKPNLLSLVGHIIHMLNTRLAILNFVVEVADGLRKNIQGHVQGFFEG